MIKVKNEGRSVHDCKGDGAVTQRKRTENRRWDATIKWWNKGPNMVMFYGGQQEQQKPHDRRHNLSIYLCIQSPVALVISWEHPVARQENSERRRIGKNCKHHWTHHLEHNEAICGRDNALMSA